MSALRGCRARAPSRVRPPPSARLRRPPRQRESEPRAYRETRPSFDRMPLSDAARSDSRSVTPSFSYKDRACFGPIPSTAVSSTKSIGNRVRSSASSAIAPRSTSSRIFDAMLAPIAGRSVRPRFPSVRASFVTDRRWSRIVDAAARYARTLNGSPRNSAYIPSSSSARMISRFVTEERYIGRCPKSPRRDDHR